SSYVSNAKPMTAMMQISHWTSVNRGAGAEGMLMENYRVGRMVGGEGNTPSARAGWECSANFPRQKLPHCSALPAWPQTAVAAWTGALGRQNDRRSPSTSQAAREMCRANAV